MKPGTFPAALRLLCMFPLLLPASAGAVPDGWVALSPSALSARRGGFATAQGLQLALGIEQVATINGQLVARNALVLDPGSAQARPAGIGAVLLQLGPGNAMLSDIGAPMPAAMVIQNTLPGQSIDTRTIITASVNSRALIGTLNFQGQLSEALARAAR